MTASPLDNLEDIIAPSSASMWPLAPAWWVVIALIVSALVAGFAYWRFVYQHNHAKRAAVALANTLDYQGAEHLQQLNMILKRLASHYYGAKAASHHSQDWCHFLQTTSRITINHEQLTLIYHPSVNPEHYTQLKQQLLQAIKRFNTRGADHV